MANLAEQRRAIGADITASRQSTAQAERRAIGAAMEASRRGTLKSDLNALESSPRKSGQLRTLERKGARPATSGVGYWNPARMPTSGAGIASPLIEKLTVVEGVGVPDRDYWPNGLTTSDGLFVLPAMKTLNLIDANGAAVQVQLANPEGTMA